MSTAAIHHLTPPAPTVEGNRRALIRQFDEARIELQVCHRIRDDLAKKLSSRTLSLLDHSYIRGVCARLAEAEVQHGAILGMLLEAPDDLDMALPEDRVSALHCAFDRLTAPTGEDEYDEHRLSGLQLIGRGF